MENIDREQLDQASEFGKRQFIQLPYLKFTATKSGKAKIKNFTLLNFDEEGEMTAEEMGEEVNVVFLARGKFKLKKGEYATGEVMPKDENIALYQYDENKKSSVVERGKWKELKESYNLSTIQIPYVLLGKEIVKLGILPSSLSNYWDYCNSFGVNERIYEYYTTIRAEDKISKNKSGEFYKILFIQGEKLNKQEMDLVAEKILEVKEIRERQKEMEDFNNEVSKDEEVEDTPNDKKSNSSSSKDDGIRVEDIPF